MKPFKLLYLFILFLCVSGCKSRSNEKPAASLTEEQKQVCDFLIETFGAPTNDVKYISTRDGGDYIEGKFDFWKNGGALRDHCTEELIQSINGLQGKAKWNEAFGATQLHNVWHKEYYFDNVFLIIVDGDWYTYFAFDGGYLCEHTIQAHVINDTVIIEDNNIENSIRPKGESTMGLPTDQNIESEWLLGAWGSESLKEFLVFGVTTRCYAIRINDLFEPLISEFFVCDLGQLCNGKFIQLEIGEKYLRVDKVSDTKLVVFDNKKEYNKVLESPVILIKQ